MGLYINENQTPDEKHWLAVFIRGVWNCVDTGNVTIFKVVKNFLCWTVVVSIVPTICKIAHKHSLSYYRYILLWYICLPWCSYHLVASFYVFQWCWQNSVAGKMFGRDRKKMPWVCYCRFKTALLWRFSFITSFKKKKTKALTCFSHLTALLCQKNILLRDCI